MDVFSFLNDRLLAGANYITKYELGVDVTYVPCFAQGTTQIYSVINPDRRGRIDPLLDPQKQGCEGRFLVRGRYVGCLL